VYECMCMCAFIKCERRLDKSLNIMVNDIFLNLFIEYQSPSMRSVQ